MSAAASEAPLKALVKEVEHLLSSLDPNVITGDKAHPVKMLWNQVGVSTYLVFFLLAALITLFVVFWGKKHMAPVPKGRAINAFELVVEFARSSLVDGVIHKDAAKYAPTILTFFFFILVNNLLGLIPGCKPGTGTISGTAALAIIVFIYFTFLGLKEKGGLGYLAGLVPHGLPKWVVPFVWLVEFVSMLMKPITHALRLFANMYAGHIIMGIFAILTQLFIVAPFAGQSWANALASPVWFLLLIVMYCMEFVVAAIQAYVFALLAAVYINQAISDGH